MANSLLDFVMSVVRDPDAAARFAANPDQAIFDANLTNVTSADVNALIPVVSESMSSLSSLSHVAPTAGLDGGIAETTGNVWTSGAATAAFDAFGDHVPAAALDDIHSTASGLDSGLDPGLDYGLITDPDAAAQPGLHELADSGIPDVAGSDDTSLQLDHPVIDEPSAHDLPTAEDWSHSVADIQQLDVDTGGFDIFD
jgi:hypothetical protein